MSQLSPIGGLESNIVLNTGRRVLGLDHAAAHANAQIAAMELPHESPELNKPVTYNTRTQTTPRATSQVLKALDKGASWFARGAVVGLGLFGLGLGVYLFHSATFGVFAMGPDTITRIEDGKQVTRENILTPENMLRNGFDAIISGTAGITEHLGTY